jgi:hypothetical protein
VSGGARSPTWLKILAGIVAIPALGVVIALLCGEALGPLANWTLIAAAIAAAVASFFLARKSSVPAAGALIALQVARHRLQKPNVFFDVSAIGSGEDFAQRISSEIAKSDAALVLNSRMSANRMAARMRNTSPRLTSPERMRKCGSLPT